MRNFRIFLKTILVVAACFSLAACAGDMADGRLANARYSDDITPFRKWTDVLARMEVQKTPNIFFRPDKPADISVVRVVNNVINGYAFLDDAGAGGGRDYWQTPQEFLARGGGDCEDFAIAKYVWLRDLGIPEHRMRIAVVFEKYTNIPHALLLVDLNGQSLALDSQAKEIKSGTVMARYTPVYSINRDGWWLY